MGRHKLPTMFTAIVRHEAPWWTGWIAEVPGVNAQEETREKLLESLRMALAEAVAMNREAAIAAAGPDYTEVEIAL